MAKPLAGSTAPSLGTRSRTCPYEARTVKSLPRYLLIVLALAGDSTMSRCLGMSVLYGGGKRPGGGARVAQTGTIVKPMSPLCIDQRPGRGPGVQLVPIEESCRDACCQARPAISQ